MDHLEIGKTVERKLDGEGEQETEHHFGNKHAVLDQMLAHSSALAKHDDVDCEHHNEQSDDEGEQLGRGDLCRCRHQHHNSSRVEEIGHPQGTTAIWSRDGPAGNDQRPVPVTPRSSSSSAGDVPWMAAKPGEGAGVSATGGRRERGPPTPQATAIDRGARTARSTTAVKPFAP
jgi:hypothetical protein